MMQNIYGQEIEIPGVSLKDAIAGTEAFAQLCRDCGFSLEELSTPEMTAKLESLNDLFPEYQAKANRPVRPWWRLWA